MESPKLEDAGDGVILTLYFESNSVIFATAGRHPG
jgi:hypothetical protein